jgi:hypothetical protein
LSTFHAQTSTSQNKSRVENFMAGFARVVKVAVLPMKKSCYSETVRLQAETERFLAMI